MKFIAWLVIGLLVQISVWTPLIVNVLVWEPGLLEESAAAVIALAWLTVFYVFARRVLSRRSLRWIVPISIAPHAVMLANAVFPIHGETPILDIALGWAIGFAVYLAFNGIAFVLAMLIDRRRSTAPGR